MKVNKIERSRKPLMITLGVLIVLGAIVSALAIGYSSLRDLYLEQCVVRDMNTQVSITSGKMVKADVLAENFGLRNGANLALIDFAKKRNEILKKIPNLRTISISRKLPDKVSITAEEREPIARLSVHGRKTETGKVVDREGVVFLCQRGTQLLPLIREATGRVTAVGHRLEKRSLAALMLIDACREVDFQELGILEVDISTPDYILATLGGSYARAKLAWEDMDEATPAAGASLNLQLSRLLKALRSRVGEGAKVWNATEFSHPGRVYADTKESL